MGSKDKKDLEKQMREEREELEKAAASAEPDPAALAKIRAKIKGKDEKGT